MRSLGAYSWFGFNIPMEQRFSLMKLAGIDSARLGFCYDSGHENCYTKGEDFLPKYGSRLMTLHLHDNDGSEDQHLVPGEGKINWPAVAGKLKAARYTDALTFEVTSEFSSLRGRETSEES